MGYQYGRAYKYITLGIQVAARPNEADAETSSGV